MFDHDILSSMFRYEDGELIRVSHRNKSFIGKPAGSYCKGNYKQVVVNGKYMLVHRIIFFLHHGYVPKMIDHIDGNVENNSIENLRAATYEQNNRNAKLRKDNKTGAKGLRQCPNGKWQVYVRMDGKQKSFGVYEDFDLAELIAIEARNKHHLHFAKHR